MPVNEECTIRCPSCGREGGLDEWTINGEHYSHHCGGGFDRILGHEKQVIFRCDGTAFYTRKPVIEIHRQEAK